MYERSLNLPTTEILIKLSKVFNISIDSLILEDQGANLITGNLNDLELAKQFEKLDKMNDKDRRLVKDLIELAIVKNEIKERLITL